MHTADCTDRTDCAESTMASLDELDDLALPPLCVSYCFDNEVFRIEYAETIIIFRDVTPDFGGIRMEIPSDTERVEFTLLPDDEKDASWYTMGIPGDSWWHCVRMGDARTARDVAQMVETLIARRGEPLAPGVVKLCVERCPRTGDQHLRTMERP